LSEGRTGYTAQGLTSDAEQAQRWEQSELTHDTITLRAIEQARLALQQLTEVTAAGIPVLLMRSTEDPYVPHAANDDLAARVHRAVDLEGVRHHPFQDAGRAEAAGTLTSWLDEVLPREG